VGQAEAPEQDADTGAGASTAKSADAARTAGRGGLAIAGAKVSFILFGFIQQPILASLLGEVGYGEMALVLTIVGIVNNVMVSTAIQGVSRAVSAVPDENAAEALAKTLRVQVVLAMIVSSVFALSAGWIADFEAAPQIANPLRVVAGVTLFYGIYAPLVGSLNGRRRFLAQAGLDTGYGALRTIAMAVGALLFGVMGSIVGFVACAALIIPVALFFSGIGKRGPAGPTLKEYLSFLGPLAGGQVALNLLMQTDFLLLSRFLGQAAATSDDASRAIAAYRAVKLFALLPYQMLVSIVFVLFPMLARAHAEGDREAVRRFTRTGVRLALIVTGLMAGVISALGPLALRFAFAAEYGDRGGLALRLMALGMGGFGMFGVMSAALTSLKRERVAAVLTIATVLMVATACYALVPQAEFGRSMLVMTAAGTSAAVLTAAAVTAIVLRQVAGGFVSPLTFGRVAIAMAITGAVGSRLPYMGKLAVLGEAAMLGSSCCERSAAPTSTW